MKNLYESLLNDEDIDRDLNDMSLIKNRYTIHHSYTPNSNTKLSKLFDIRKLKSYIKNNDFVKYSGKLLLAMDDINLNGINLAKADLQREIDDVMDYLDNLERLVFIYKFLRLPNLSKFTINE